MINVLENLRPQRMVERLIIVISHVDVMMSGASTALHLRLTLVPFNSMYFIF